jgi:hypothetical protein
MDENFPANLRKLIATMNKKNNQMILAGVYTTEAIQQTRANSLKFIQSHYSDEMEQRIREERYRQKIIKERYADLVKSSLPDQTQLELLRSKLDTMTNDQLIRYSEQVRLGNTKQTFALPYEARELGATMRRRGMAEEADQIALFTEAIHIDEPFLSDPDFKDAESKISKLTVFKNQAEYGAMFCLPSDSNLNIKKDSIILMDKISEVTE